MNIGVIGLGKLGCSMFAAFAAAGNNVFGFDINENVRNDLRRKIAPVAETDLQNEIPVPLYRAVAEVIAYVYKLAEIQKDSEKPVKPKVEVPDTMLFDDLGNLEVRA